MAQPTSSQGIVRLECVCGGEVLLDPELLGRIVPCPHCGRLLRAALQFLLVDETIAPNITVPCPCGRFIVAQTSQAGKEVTCRACGRKLTVPRPVERANARRVVRVPPDVLKKQLRRGRAKARGSGGPRSRRGTAGAAKTVSLKPGQQVCANPECGSPLPIGANVCFACGTNVKTGLAYEGRGPEGDPAGKWHAP